MSVINTLHWLKDTSHPLDLCKKLCPYFLDLNEKVIAKYLYSFGMYKSNDQIKQWIEKIKKEDIYTFIQNEERKLQREWNGPDIPIFILPCDQNNRKIATEYKGRSGLAFKNKLFLFISPETKKEDILSLFIHEYHHVCRLSAITKKEADFTIIDTIILEGLAENAVREKLGEDKIASWAKLYSPMQCERFLKRMIHPQKETTRQSHKFSQIMYGTGLYPKMLGYSVGYYIVERFMTKTSKRTKELLKVPAEAFLKDS